MMMMMLVLRSTDSLDLYTNNTAHDYTVQLLHPIALKGNWTVALREVTTDISVRDQVTEDIYVYCNLCQTTPVGDREEPLLKRVYLGNPPN